jgi:hypothetical protein
MTIGICNPIPYFRKTKNADWAEQKVNSLEQQPATMHFLLSASIPAWRETE